MNETKKQKTPENIGFMKKAARFVAAPLIAGLITLGCGAGMKNVETKTPKKGCTCLEGKVEFYKPIWFKVESAAADSEQRGIGLKAPANQPISEKVFKPIPLNEHGKLSDIKINSKPFARFEYQIDDGMVYKSMPPVNKKIGKPSDLKKITKPFTPLE